MAPHWGLYYKFVYQVTKNSLNKHHANYKKKASVTQLFNFWTEFSCFSYNTTTINFNNYLQKVRIGFYPRCHGYETNVMPWARNEFNATRTQPWGVQASTTLCRCQARVNGEASQKTQPNIPLKRSFYLLLISSSYSYLKFFVLIHGWTACFNATNKGGIKMKSICLYSKLSIYTPLDLCCSRLILFFLSQYVRGTSTDHRIYIDKSLSVIQLWP